MSFLHLTGLALHEVIFCYKSALAAIMKYHWQSTTETLFLTVLEGGSPKSECVHTQGLVRALFLGLQKASFCHVLIWQSEGREKTQAFTSVSACKDTNPIDQGPTSMTSFNRNSIKPLFPNTVTLGVGFNIWI